ncbi:hypothetical protein N7U66_04155 [Lacinutrix neustonica]|uniref:Uncharacterized protein n=1 Tax=Lacinutrix neustonica TaxID=2980107 RepID=A0A9E8MYZ5_9FLAO|nr:hypothetical protein [Lacinutrix neustonica]WAC02835.1 hypothetical protein N7U66_04155 [Lacinutrix neustonica]
MFTLIIVAVVVILLTVAIVWVIDKFIPSKAKPFLTIVLWIFIGALGYLTFMSVYNPILFKQEKEKRYAKVIENLVDIRDSQLAYKEINGKYTKSYDSLINFIENAKFAILERRDTSVIDVEKTKAYRGIEYRKEITVTDTLDFVSVKDSLFKGSDRYKTMKNVPFAKEGTEFVLNAGKIQEEEGDKKLSVFEAYVKKADVLHDQDPDYVNIENTAHSVEEINGDAIRVGSMQEVKVNGNWPKLYDPK